LRSPPGEELVPSVYPVRELAVLGVFVVDHAASGLEPPVLPSCLPVVVVVVEDLVVLSLGSLSVLVALLVHAGVVLAGHASHDLVVGAVVVEVVVEVVHPLAPCAVLGSVSSSTSNLEHSVLLPGVVLGGLVGGHVLAIGAGVAVVALVVVLPLDVEGVEFVEAVVSPLAVAHAISVLVVAILVAAIHVPVVVVVVVIVTVVVVPIPVVHVVHVIHAVPVPVLVVSVLVIVVVILSVVAVALSHVLLVLVVVRLSSGRTDHQTQECQGWHRETGHFLSTL